jgi:hypothetical protein
MSAKAEVFSLRQRLCKLLFPLVISYSFLFFLILSSSVKKVIEKAPIFD